MIELPAEFKFPLSMDDWHVEHVIDWMQTLKLAKDYSQMIKNEGIDGRALRLISLQTEWENFGILKGDVLKIKSVMEKLKS